MLGVLILMLFNFKILQIMVQRVNISHRNVTAGLKLICQCTDSITKTAGDEKMAVLNEDR